MVVNEHSFFVVRISEQTKPNCLLESWGRIKSLSLLSENGREKKKKKMPLIKCLHLICEFSQLVELLVYAIKSRVLGEEYKRTCASKGNMKRRGKRSGNEILLRMREILCIS